jgi:superfamily II DNA or RNA helicase/HKD family nuclease
MPTPIPDYTDNEKYKLIHVLTSIISEYQETRLDLATGFFSPDIWRVVGKTFSSLTAFRLLIGSEPDVKAKREGLNLQAYYRKLLKKTLEDESLDEKNARVIDDLIGFLKNDFVQVRLFDDPFLHAKAYIFERTAIVGSSNFTFPGLMHNSELNLVQKTEWVTQALRRDWFEPFWARSEEYKTALIETLEKSKFGAYQYQPFDVFIKVLFENYRDTLISSDSETDKTALDLASFQQEGYRLAKMLLERHGAVMVADAVGLGKTFIGLSILEEFILGQRSKNHIPKAIIVCPAQLRDSVWQPALDRYSIPARIVTMEELGREDFSWKSFVNIDLVLVDESHNFRKPSTNRYRNLMRLISTGKPDKKVALLTATPINNSIFDLYYQMRLMAKGHEDHYAAQGIPNLQNFFFGVKRGTTEFFDLIEHTMVRRSRRDVRRRQEQGEQIIINGEEIHFPTRTLHRLEYSLFDQFGGFYDGFIRRIERLHLVAYNLERYKRQQDQIEVDRREALTGIFKTNFLKRLESSIRAFQISIENQHRFQTRFYDFFADGKLLDAGTQRKLEQVLRLLDAEDDSEGVLERYDHLLEGLPVVNRMDYDIPRMEADLRSDTLALEWMQQKVSELLESGLGDAKLEAIKARLLEPRLKGQKIVLFTYFADTAQYLFKGLTQDEVWKNAAEQPKIAVVTGATPAKTRADQIGRFAPRNRSEEASTTPLLPEDEIQILISTDVLSEGQNLQDAGLLMNADLHWNPVRMIQRAGRIDRLGSPFPELQIHNVFPEQGLEDLLGLVGRLERRISEIDRTVGLDASVLGEVIAGRSLDELRRLRGNDPTLLDDLESENELTAADEMRLPLIEALLNLGEEYVKDLPLGIHSSRVAPNGAKGVFMAFRADDRVLWRVYPTEGQQADLISVKRQIYKLIQSTRDVTPRAANPIGESIFVYLERAIKDIVQESKRQVKSGSFKAPLKGINKRINQRLNELSVISDVTLLQRLLHSVEQRSLTVFEKDTELLRILEIEDLQDFMLELDAFFVENHLHSQQDSQRMIAQLLKEENIVLIAYEWLT